MSHETLRELPGIESILNAADVQPLVRDWGRLAVRESARIVQAELRRTIGNGRSPDLTMPALVRGITLSLIERGGRGPRPVFNLTGTVVHTNLGRALLPQSAIEAIGRAARYPVDLEFDLNSGKRGDRDAHIEQLLCDLTGAEAATVVNNNAAAVLLILNTLALNREVPVSRGELIEIGGSFRIPDIMARAGCRLREIGTTNRTHESDYVQALGAETALILKVHPSNYVIEGFTAEVSERNLAEIAKSRNIPFVVDLGSGTLLKLSKYGLPDEPTPMETLRHGADLVCFSGDKLLGGPQSGIIVGRRTLIERLNANPMKRALRIDKLTTAALVEVLKLYTEPERLREELPVIRQLTRPADEIAEQASRLIGRIDRSLPDFAVAPVELKSQIGSGALPLREIDSAGVELTPIDVDRAPAELRRLGADLRKLPRPIIGRLQQDRLVMDFRCLDDESVFIEELDGLPQLNQ